MTYRSVEWHTKGDGLIYEIAVEYGQTFWQWLLRKPGTVKRWHTSDRKQWLIMIDGGDKEVMSVKEVRELLKAMDYVHTQIFLRGLEDRCEYMLARR